MQTETLLKDIQSRTSGALTVGSVVSVLGDLLQAQDLYYGHGTDNSHDEAFALVFSVLELDFDRAETLWQQPVAPDQLDAIVALAGRRIQERLPLPYLTGEAWFAGIRFRIDKRALIPRSPIAELIMEQFQPWVASRNGPRVLDMCTGNGCIGIASALYMPGAQVDLVDVSTSALELARENIAMHGVESRVEIIHSDLFANLAGRKYDLIVSNPPYVPASSMSDLPVEYRHEPEMALLADDRGMAVVHRILTDAAHYLNDNGVLIVEVGEIAEQVHEHYRQLPFIWLDFEHGGEGVFLLHKDDLMDM